jgi:hypothetical protein
LFSQEVTDVAELAPFLPEIVDVQRLWNVDGWSSGLTSQIDGWYVFTMDVEYEYVPALEPAAFALLGAGLVTIVAISRLMSGPSRAVRPAGWEG